MLCKKVKLKQINIFRVFYQYLEHRKKVKMNRLKLSGSDFTKHNCDI